ncbi:General stress protein 69 [Planctomycetes bacterium CA13]|uniref:General stress protein 69 n=1 Tax=Novipirellula herctigrandis TaxID=2527986 RepID=A0A5C5Z6X5_9BACT|nr:General stress protein 69 [Planctomycetes bacterium CA13]
MLLPTRILGRTGLSVTQLGYGSMGLRGPQTWGVRVVDESHAERMLNLVLDSGINFIDTAPDYGISEERIGRYIASRRDEYILATKCGCDYTQHEDHLEINHVWSKDVVERNLHTSLDRMKTDHIDLLQFHGGDAKTLVQNGLIDQLVSFRDRGLVRFVGVSSKIPELEGLIELGVFDTYQIPYSCLAPEHGDLIVRAAKQGAGIIVRGGVAQGGPDAEIQRPNLNQVWERAGLDGILPDGMSRAEMILRFTLSHPAISTTIVGTCNEAHMIENVAAANAGPLSDKLVTEIKVRIP